MVKLEHCVFGPNCNPALSFDSGSGLSLATFGRAGTASQLDSSQATHVHNHHSCVHDAASCARSWLQVISSYQIQIGHPCIDPGGHFLGALACIIIVSSINNCLFHPSLAFVSYRVGAPHADGTPILWHIVSAVFAAPREDPGLSLLQYRLLAMLHSVLFSLLLLGEC